MRRMNFGGNRARMLALLAGGAFVMIPASASAARSLIRLVTENGIIADSGSPGVWGTCTEGNEVHAEDVGAERDAVFNVSLTHIPSGSTITRMHAYGIDTEVNGAVTFRLRRSTVANATSTTHTWSSVTSATTWSTSALSIPIDHGTHSWWIEVTIPGGFPTQHGPGPQTGLSVHTVGIEYTP